MFTALITYNCSLINPPELLGYNETSPNCSVTMLENDSKNDTINVTCDKIEDFAGRNWVFSLSRNFSSQIIENETFAVTLEPIPLSEISINESKIENFTAIFSIPNCTKIADSRYLVFRCNSSDESNNTLSNCTFTCSDLVPGSAATASLVRLAIPIEDKTIDNETFVEERKYKSYRTG